jgi:hypothetical protein
MDFIREHENEIETYANLDSIGSAKQTWKNQAIMEANGFHPIPVYHLDEPKEYLKKCMKYDYFAVGGLASAKGRSLKPFLINVFRELCTKESDYYPTHKVHGFGITTPSIITAFPWYCMTEEDHTVLTKKGWCSLSELSVGTEILAFNEGVTEWQKIEKIPIFEVTDVPINHMHNRNFDAHVTDNHKWIVTDHIKRGEKYKWRNTRSLSRADCINRVGNNYKFLSKPLYSDEQIILLAWFWTDGTINVRNKCKTNSVSIHQSERANLEKCNIIRDVLQKGKERFCESRSGNRMIDFELYGEISQWLLQKAPGRILPKELPLQLTREQAELFIKHSVLADGSVSGLKRRKGFGITVKRERKKENLEVLRTICLLLGIPTSIYEGEFKTLLSSSVDHIYVNHLYEKKYLYSGRLWCVQVKSHAFFTKCNNKIYVTGNSVDSTSWVQYGRYGIILTPNRTNGIYRYDLPPDTIAVSFRSKAIGDSEHFANYTKLERENLLQYCKEKGFLMGKVKIKKVKVGYILKENEHWIDRKIKDKVEVVLEKGLCCDGDMRDALNLLYFLDLEKNQPKWPWRWISSKLDFPEESKEI